jgi:deoxyribodipyrimidine photolyase-related protein
MKTAALIFPNQLFEHNPALIKTNLVFLIEESLFFKQYKFHKQKLVFHRSSMKSYQDYLERKKFKVIYINSKNELSDIRILIQHLNQKGIEEIHFADVVDNWLEKRIKQSADKAGIVTCKYQTPCFLNSEEELIEYFKGKKKFSQTEFYIKQRKKFKILLHENDSPIGGKWTYDAENRLKYPKDKKPPRVTFPEHNKYYYEAVAYVNKYFPDNYGEINTKFNYPVTFDESKKWFRQFLEKRFDKFGDFEDAIVADENILHHSLLTPMFNSGPLTPKYIIETSLNYSEKK